MNTTKIESKTKQIKNAQKKMDSLIKEFEEITEGVSDFPISLSYMESDGFVFFNGYTGENAPIDKCIKEIKETGILSSYLFENFDI